MKNSKFLLIAGLVAMGTLSACGGGDDKQVEAAAAPAPAAPTPDPVAEAAQAIIDENPSAGLSIQTISDLRWFSQDVYTTGQAYSDARDKVLKSVSVDQLEKIADGSTEEAPGAQAVLAYVYSGNEHGRTTDMAKQVAYLDKACTGKVGGACHTQGYLLAAGISTVPKDMKRSAAAYKAGCDAKYVDACFAMGEAHSFGYGAEKSFALALPYYETTCDQGGAQGCVKAATIHNANQVTGADPTKAAAYSKRACELGLQSSCGTGGSDTAVTEPVTTQTSTSPAALVTDEDEINDLLGITPKGPSDVRTLVDGVNAMGIQRRDDFIDAVKALYAVAKPADLETEKFAKSAAAKTALAFAYQNGAFGASHDYAKAVSLYSPACITSKVQSACYELGKMYADGKGVEQNAATAVNGFKRGCGTYAEACDALGDAYMSGTGVAADKAKAYDAYKQGCSSLSAHSCKVMAEGSMSGDVGVKDVNTGVFYYETGCKAGDVDQCVKLGDMFKTGDQVTAMKARSDHYYKLACDLDDTASCLNVGIVK